MTRENQFAVYQMKQTPETRQMRFRSYQTLQEKGIRIRQLPHSFAGHSISVSDVLVFHHLGIVSSYYVEKNGFTVIEDFIKKESSPSGAAVSIDTTNFQIEGKAGRWIAFDNIRLEGKEFSLMEHETYGKEAAWVLAKLHKKQAEIARRGRKKECQQAAENDMEWERKQKKECLAVSRMLLFLFPLSLQNKHGIQSYGFICCHGKYLSTKCNN